MEQKKQSFVDDFLKVTLVPIAVVLMMVISFVWCMIAPLIGSAYIASFLIRPLGNYFQSVNHAAFLNWMDSKEADAGERDKRLAELRKKFIGNVASIKPSPGSNDDAIAEEIVSGCSSELESVTEYYATDIARDMRRKGYDEIKIAKAVTDYLRDGFLESRSALKQEVLSALKKRRDDLAAIGAHDSPLPVK